MTPYHRLPLLAVILLSAGVAVWAIGRSSAAETEARTLAAMRDSVAHVVARRAKVDRDRAAVERAAYQSAERKRLMMRPRVDTVLAHFDSVTHAVDTASTDADSLRRSLVTTLAAYDSLAGAFRAYLRVSDAAASAASRTIAAQATALAKADTALTAMTAARDQWKRAATCRVLGVRCPTRVQAFTVGALLTLGLVVAR